jgi:hypothetical protein
MYKKRADLSLSATRLLAWGTGTMIVVAGFGVLAFYTVPAHTEDAHAGMWWHFVANTLSLILLAVAASVRWRSRAVEPTPWIRAVMLSGALVMGFGAYMGGDIVYHGGAGIDPEILAPEIRMGHMHGAAGAGGHEHSHE